MKCNFYWYCNSTDLTLPNQIKCHSDSKLDFSCFLTGAFPWPPLASLSKFIFIKFRGLLTPAHPYVKIWVAAAPSTPLEGYVLCRTKFALYY